MSVAPEAGQAPSPTDATQHDSESIHAIHEIRCEPKQTEPSPTSATTPTKPPTSRSKAGLLLALKIIGIVAALYFFIVSLRLLSDAFRIFGGTTAGEAFRKSSIFSNPIAGLMLGVLVTVLLQSSSTSISIVVSLVGSGQISVQNAVYIVMGANIGTTVTSVLVTFSQVRDQTQFELAFRAATVHDMFNILSVCTFLPLEAGTHFIAEFTGLFTKGMPKETEEGKKQFDFIKAVTNPLVKRVVQYDKDVIKNIATTGNEEGRIVSVEESGHWFTNTGLSDTVVGIVVLIVAIALLAGCLICLVKLLSALLSTKVRKYLKEMATKEEIQEAPRCKRCLKKSAVDYGLMGLGLVVTLAVQSSSICISTLVPLAGLGLVTLQKMVPIVLGANLGTTCTALIAASAQHNKHDAMQIALCHLMFNILGVLLWFVIPFMRAVPIGCARALGYYISRHRWLGPVYVLVCFGVVPGSLFGLSLAGATIFMAVFGPILGIILLLVVLQVVRQTVPYNYLKKFGPLAANPSWLPVLCWTKDARRHAVTLAAANSGSPLHSVDVEVKDYRHHDNVAGSAVRKEDEVVHTPLVLTPIHNSGLSFQPHIGGT